MSGLRAVQHQTWLYTTGAVALACSDKTWRMVASTTRPFFSGLSHRPIQRSRHVGGTDGRGWALDRAFSPKPGMPRDWNNTADPSAVGRPAHAESRTPIDQVRLARRRTSYHCETWRDTRQWREAASTKELIRFGAPTDAARASRCRQDLLRHRDRACRAVLDLLMGGTSKAVRAV